MHKIPLSDIESEGLKAHGLAIRTPSQSTDVFRHGVKWGQEHPPEGYSLVPDEPCHIITEKIFLECASSDEIEDDDLGMEFYKAMIKAAKEGE